MKDREMPPILVEKFDPRIRYQTEHTQEQDWNTFTATGLLWLVNTLLGVFGWTIVVGRNDQTGEVVKVFPARTKFRGFDSRITMESYRKINQYMADHAKEINEEAKND